VVCEKLKLIFLLLFNFDSYAKTVLETAPKTFGTGMYLLAVFLLRLIFIFLLITIAYYIFLSIVMYIIGRKLNVKPTWLAWIPIVNMFYIPMLAGYKWYYAFLLLLSMVPVVGIVVVPVLMIWWWWMIAQRRGFHGALALLCLIPIVNFVMIGIFAWVDPKKR